MTFLPRRPVSSWSSGVSRNRSTDACAANSSRSRKSCAIWTVRCNPSVAVPRSATGRSGTSCTPSTAQATQATPPAATPRVAAVRCATTSRASRSTASGTAVRTAAASSSATSTAPAAPAAPNDSRTKSSALPSSGQSTSGSNGRSRIDTKPMSKTFRTASSARATPSPMAVPLRYRAGSTSISAVPTSASTGMRRNAPGASLARSSGRTSAASTANAARTVSTGRAIRRQLRGCARVGRASSVIERCLHSGRTAGRGYGPCGWPWPRGTRRWPATRTPRSARARSRPRRAG